MGLYKRGKVWWISFTIDGRQRYTSLGTQDRKLAEKIAHKIMGDVVTGRWFEQLQGDQKTFSVLADLYESTAFHELRGWQHSQSYLNQLKQFFGHYPLIKITSEVIDEFRRYRRQHGVTPATINRQLTILRRMFTLAKRRWQWIKEIPDIERERYADRERVRHLRFDEYHRVLEACGDWLKPVVIVAAWTGIRLGNLVSLQRSQIDLESGLLLIEADKNKNNARVGIPLATPTYEVLRHQLEISSHSYVFCWGNGKPYRQDTVSHAFLRATRRARIEDFRFHDLRHCFASWLRASGVDVFTIADLLGHKSTQMTMRYAHLNNQEMMKAVKGLEQLYDNFMT